MRIASFKIDDVPHNVRKLQECERRKVKEEITEKLASGTITLGEGLRLMRLAAGMTQAQYAEMTGVDLRILAAVEKGKGNPRLDTLQKLGSPYGLMVSFVKPQVERTKRSPILEERLNTTNNHAEDLRRIASLLTRIAETTNTDSITSQQNHVASNSLHVQKGLTAGRARRR